MKNRPGRVRNLREMQAKKVYSHETHTGWAKYRSEGAGTSHRSHYPTRTSVALHGPLVSRRHENRIKELAYCAMVLAVLSRISAVRIRAKVAIDVG
jgi:hypothetical protein